MLRVDNNNKKKTTGCAARYPAFPALHCLGRPIILRQPSTSRCALCMRALLPWTHCGHIGTIPTKPGPFRLLLPARSRLTIGVYPDHSHRRLASNRNIGGVWLHSTAEPGRRTNPRPPGVFAARSARVIGSLTRPFSPGRRIFSHQGKNAVQGERGKTREKRSGS